MSRLVRQPVSFFGLALILFAVPLWWHFRVPTSAILADAPALNAVEKAPALSRAGIDAKSLAAAGVSANSATACAQAAVTHLLGHPTAISDANSAYGNARRESDRLERLIQSGKAGAEDVTAYQSQKTALASAVTQRQSALDALYASTTANLSSQQKSLLAAIRANSANADVSVEFRTIERSKADWVQLRGDLANERISAKAGVAASEEGQTRLAVCRANAKVAAAKTSLDTNLAAVTAALHTALAGN